MIRDFFYYWREYGFKATWVFRKDIFRNNAWIDNDIMRFTDYELGIYGSTEFVGDIIELGY